MRETMKAFLEHLNQNPALKDELSIKTKSRPPRWIYMVVYA